MFLGKKSSENDAWITVRFFQFLFGGIFILYKLLSWISLTYSAISMFRKGLLYFLYTLLNNSISSFIYVFKVLLFSIIWKRTCHDAFLTYCIVCVKIFEKHNWKLFCRQKSSWSHRSQDSVCLWRIQIVFYSGIQKGRKIIETKKYCFQLKTNEKMNNLENLMECWDNEP